MNELIRALPQSIVTVIALIFTVAIILLVFGIWKLLKHLVTHAKIGLKFGNKELSINKEKNEKNLNINESFTSVITNILNYSSEKAYDSSVLRQNLFDDQVRNAKSKFEMIKTLIIGDYAAKESNANIDLVDIILDNIIDIEVIIKLEKIFQVDKLTEKSKEVILNLYKPFIDRAASNIHIEVQKLIKPSNTLFNENILLCIDAQSDLIRKSLIEILEYAYDESKNYFVRLKDLNEKYSILINNTLKSYFYDNEQIVKSFPNIWNESAPPNSVVGDI